MPWMKDRSGAQFKTGGARRTPPTTPVLSGLNPSGIVVDTPTPITVTGTGFVSGSKVWADEEAQATTYVGPTTLTYTAQADAVGAQDITVHTGALVSNALSLAVSDQPV